MATQPVFEREAQSVSVPIGRVEGVQSTNTDDRLAVEEALEIRLGQRSLSITMRTPGNDFELAAGFLFAEGMISGRKDIETIEYTPEGKEDQAFNIVTVSLRQGVELDAKKLLRHFYVTSSCGVCGKTSLEAVRVLVQTKLPPGEPRISSSIVGLLPGTLRRS